MQAIIMKFGIHEPC